MIEMPDDVKPHFDHSVTGAAYVIGALAEIPFSPGEMFGAVLLNSVEGSDEERISSIINRFSGTMVIVTEAIKMLSEGLHKTPSEITAMILAQVRKIEGITPPEGDQHAQTES